MLASERARSWAHRWSGVAWRCRERAATADSRRAVARWQLREVGALQRENAAKVRFAEARRLEQQLANLREWGRLLTEAARWCEQRGFAELREFNDAAANRWRARRSRLECQAMEVFERWNTLGGTDHGTCFNCCQLLWDGPSTCGKCLAPLCGDCNPHGLGEACPGCTANGDEGEEDWEDGYWESDQHVMRAKGGAS